ncbi:trypsin-like serine peptidase [Fibrella forsythiae]|uniref:Serine protease n=1 Tax=Fibrella forsythiae TaxID=2817061 RepID=A0ABS3JKT6_9BACT|nr:serine protease [Fibrella forsythiae]MBO0950613.1 trypsin-like peptidase domain-containing protein [Fibrella forsythiae]
MDWNNDLTTLNYHLAQLYSSREEAYRVATNAKFNTIMIEFDGRSITRWFNILDYARKTSSWNRIITLLEEITKSNELGACDELVEGILDNFRKGQFSISSSKTIAGTPKKVDEERGLEKLMGPKSNLLPISFLDQGVQCARAVVRIVTPEGLGSGFLVGDNLLITNNHVLRNREIAKQAKIQFNYQKTLQGLDTIFEEFSLDPTTAFLTSTDTLATKDFDFTIVKVRGDIAQFGTLPLSKVSAQKGDFVNIIQHPSGGPKQIALYNNIVTGVDETVVQYLTDTLPGSSGSPVFNSTWEVVALHHAGGNLVDPASKQTVFRNEGINSLRIQEALQRL